MNLGGRVDVHVTDAAIGTIADLSFNLSGDIVVPAELSRGTSPAVAEVAAAAINRWEATLGRALGGARKPMAAKGSK